MALESTLMVVFVSVAALALIVWVVADIIRARRQFQVWALQDEVWQRVFDHQQSAEHPPSRLRQSTEDAWLLDVLETIRRCAHDRQGEIAGETTTYEDAFRKLEIASGALRFIEGHAEDALREMRPCS